MPMWLLFQHRGLFEENNWGESTGWENKETDSSNTPNDDAGEKKEDNNSSIPKYRFDEVNEKRKAAEAELAKYKEAEAKKAEEEALKKWEYEKIISQKDQEIADYKKQQESWKAREEAMTKRNEERTSKLAEDKEFWNNAKSLVDWVSDPFTLSSKLDALEAMHNSQKKSSSWGSDMPSWWNWSGRLAELQEKARKWEHLTNLEQQEYLKLAREKRSKEN